MSEALITAENQPRQQQPQQQLEQLQTSAPSISNDELSDLETEPRHRFYEKVYTMAENFAATHVGQFVIECGDDALKTVETTAKWSLPQDSSVVKLVRPLSWLPFLVLIVILRVIRLWCSLAALMIGDPPVTARDMVRFIQTRRRKLRAVRLNGLKEINRRATEANALMAAKRSESGIIRKAQKLLAIAICRPGQERGRVFVHRSKEQLCGNKAVDSPNRTERNRTESNRAESNEKSDLNLTCLELLDKYANANSEDDSDYVPNPEEEDSNDDESTTSGGNCSVSSTNSADELEHEQSTTTSNTTSTTTKPPVATSTAAAETNNKDGEQSQSQSTTSPTKIHDNSVEIKDKANGRKRPMPKPLEEIKNEPMSDNDSSSNEQQAQTPNVIGPKTPPGEGPKTPPGDASDEPPAADVATQKANNPLSLPNGGNQQKSTPGHESAAMMKPQVPTVFGTTATAVPTNTDELSTYSTSSSILCNSSASVDNPVHLSTSISALSSSSSSSASLANSDFLTNEEFIVNDNLSEPRTPTPTLNSSRFGNIGSSNLISASSSEDIFYSPIGSPPDFNAVFKPVSILKKPIVEQPRLSSAHSSPKAVDLEDTESQSDSSASQKKNNTQNQKNHNHSQNRNRKHNRR